jgi:NifU-like protein involved in Fe-S cluster formation
VEVFKRSGGASLLKAIDDDVEACQQTGNACATLTASQNLSTSSCHGSTVASTPEHLRRTAVQALPPQNKSAGKSGASED